MSSSQRVITDTNKAPLVQVLTLMLLVIAILSCIVRTGTKWHIFKGLKLDDYLAILSTVFASAQSAIIFHSCEHGLGRLWPSLSADDETTFFKTQYVANAFFILSILCSKLSGTVSLRMLSRSDHLWLVRGCEIVVGLWGVSSLVANFFQCGLPKPWDYSDASKCIDRQALWNYYSATNIITDLAIISIMAENIRRINAAFTKKTLLIAVFGCRIFIVPATAAQIYFSNKAFESDDLSFSIWESTIAMELVQCLAIFTVCAPNLKPFLDSLESGQIRIDDLRRQGKSSNGGYPSYPGDPYVGRSGEGSGKPSKRSRVKGVLTTATSQHSNVHELVDLSPSRKGETVTEATVGGKKGSWDGQSDKSHSSQAILVHHTWQVDVQKAQDHELTK